MVQELQTDPNILLALFNFKDQWYFSSLKHHIQSSEYILVKDVIWYITHLITVFKWEVMMG